LLRLNFFETANRPAFRGLKLLDPDEWLDTHMTAVKVLEKTGLFVEDPKALEISGSSGRPM
jgi:hypothetical protein